MPDRAPAGDSRRRRTDRPDRRWRGRAAAVLAAIVLPAGAAWSSASAACWPAPVNGVIVDRFRPPACPWCPGNRGLEYRTGPGGVVRSVEAGVVTFSGSVAGVRYVVVQLASGWKITYGRLGRVVRSRGDRVVSGSVVGTAGGELFFGVRVDGRHIDPEPHLGRLVGRPRLIPTDGAAARPAPPPRLRCRE